MIKRAGVLAVVFMVLALSAANLQATVIEIGLTAEINYINDPNGLLNGLTIGDTITGSYIYDSGTMDGNPDTSFGAYQHYSFPSGVSLNADGFVFQTEPDNVDFLFNIGNNYISPTTDSYLFRSYNNLPLDGGVYYIAHISWSLRDNTGTAISSDALPMTPPVLTDWLDGNILRIEASYNPGGQDWTLIGAEVTSVELIPEPGTVLLLGLGGVILLRRRSG